MYFTVYETTNLVNGKTYIGKHQTNNPNDSYKGSGKLISRAMDKYGEEWFDKNILFIFDNEDDMNAKEKEIVTEEFCKLKSNYNLCPGGEGGFGYINSEGLGFPITEASKVGRANLSKLRLESKDFRDNENVRLRKMSVKGVKARIEKYPDGTFAGKKHSEDTLIKMREAHARTWARKGSQKGKRVWINNSVDSKFVLKEELDNYTNLGYSLGRL